jgi:hypothetical protein
VYAGTRQPLAGQDGRVTPVTLDVTDAAQIQAGAGMIRPPQLPCLTPCPGWNLNMLLDHLSDSIGVLTEAIADAAMGDREPGPDPVARLRGQAAGLLDACTAAGPSGRRITVGDRELTGKMVAVTAAMRSPSTAGTSRSRAVPASQYRQGWRPSCCRSPRCSLPRVPGLGCSRPRSNYPAPPAPATSSSPSSAASRDRIRHPT